MKKGLPMTSEAKAKMKKAKISNAATKVYGGAPNPNK